MKIHKIRVGMVGLGMIFLETYLPVFLQNRGVLRVSDKGILFEFQLVGVASRTNRAHQFISEQFAIPCFFGEHGVSQLLDLGVDALCVATPDDFHLLPALQGLDRSCHVLIEKPSVLNLQDLDSLLCLSKDKNCLGRVVYHKLLDPDHKKLRTLVCDGHLNHVNSGYCTLLEPRSISLATFAAWVSGRNPSTYVAVHYFKLIDFTFGGSSLTPAWKLKRVSCNGQRGIVGEKFGPTWDSVQNQIVYQHADGREACFDIHTSWVNPDNFPGYVDQEVQFRFDNGIWNASQRKRGVELVVEGRTPHEFKTNINNHYNASTLEPWGRKRSRGYGLEVIERFFDEVAFVEWGGNADERDLRLEEVRRMEYADLSADRNVVAMVQATEALLFQAAQGKPGATVEVNGPLGGLVLRFPGDSTSEVLYQGNV